MLKSSIGRVKNGNRPIGGNHPRGGERPEVKGKVVIFVARLTLF